MPDRTCVPLSFMFIESYKKTLGAPPSPTKEINLLFENPCELKILPRAHNPGHIFLFSLLFLTAMRSWNLIFAIVKLLIIQETLHSNVMCVEHLVFCEQLTLKITGEESSTHVSLRSATSLCMYT